METKKNFTSPNNSLSSLSGFRRPAEGRMHMHLPEEDLELYVRGRVPANHTLTIRGHLAECPDCAERLAVTQNFLRAVDELSQGQSSNSEHGDRRQEPRTPVDDAAIVRVVNPFLPDQWGVRILDASKNGLKLIVPVLLQPGMIVQIRLENMIAFAEVRYCTKAGSEFHIGVQIQEIIPTMRASKAVPLREATEAGI